MTRGFGRFLRRNTIALLALFLALGGTSYAAATLINGSQIKPHTIAKNRLTNKAIKQLKGNRGPRGVQGTAGAQGAKGATGAQGAQGPGGAILTYDAAASANTTPTVLGTALGSTIGATCNSTGGDAELAVYIRTSDGSWNIDYSYVSYDAATATPNTYVNKIILPAGTLTSLLQVDSRTATAGTDQSDGQLDFDQLGPVAGHMIWHETAITTASAQTCHLSVMSFPTTISGVTGSAGARPVHSRLPIHLSR
jgi:hypothetical protein